MAQDVLLIHHNFKFFPARFVFALKKDAPAHGVPPIKYILFMSTIRAGYFSDNLPVRLHCFTAIRSKTWNSRSAPFCPPLTGRA